jgi:hypothetical protein
LEVNAIGGFSAKRTDIELKFLTRQSHEQRNPSLAAHCALATGAPNRAMWLQHRRKKRSRSWPVVEGRVESSSVKVESTGNNQSAVFAQVRYSYSSSGESHSFSEPQTATNTRTQTLTPLEASSMDPANQNLRQNGQMYERTVTETTTTMTTRTVPTSQIVWKDKTVSCGLGLLAPAGKVSAVDHASLQEMAVGLHGIGSIMDSVKNVPLGATSVEDVQNASKTAANRDPDPGLRMQGRYAEQGGLDIEFLHSAAVVGCNKAAFVRDYTVSLSGNRVLVNIQNPGSPIRLELKSDGTLAGSGTAKLEGKALLGMDVNNHPVFRTISDACALRVFPPVKQ